MDLATDRGAMARTTRCGFAARQEIQSQRVGVGSGSDVQKARAWRGWQGWISSRSTLSAGYQGGFVSGSSQARATCGLLAQRARDNDAR